MLLGAIGYQVSTSKAMKYVSELQLHPCPTCCSTEIMVLNDVGGSQTKDNRAKVPFHEILFCIPIPN